MIEEHRHVGLSPFPSGAQFCTCGEMITPPFDKEQFIAERLIIALWGLKDRESKKVTAL